MDKQTKKIKELNKNDVDKPSYKALFCLELMKLVFLALVLFISWTLIHAGYNYAMSAFSETTEPID